MKNLMNIIDLKTKFKVLLYFFKLNVAIDFHEESFQIYNQNNFKFFYDKSSLENMTKNKILKNYVFSYYFQKMVMLVKQILMQ